MHFCSIVVLEITRNFANSSMFVHYLYPKKFSSASYCASNFYNRITKRGDQLSIKNRRIVSTFDNIYQEQGSHGWIDTRMLERHVNLVDDCVVS